MGDPVISLRDGDEILWVHSLAAQEDEADGGTVTRPPRPRPTLPTLGVSAAESDDSTGTEET
ncbi:MAG: hypothetical protein LC808_20185, partial [Actinobacteria bacterium]|nr:hypothetical protein [Actinomycetota bacterium]